MMPVQLGDITHRYGDRLVLDTFRLRLEPARTTCLLGPSGSGKSTVLSILAGLVVPESGRVEAPADVACVFQELRLLPWRTVMGNLLFVLKGQLPPDRLEARIEAMLRLVELWEERHTWPHQLSGGMKQRVALARALSMPASLLLLDEPFKGLDAALRERIMTRCRALWLEEGQTVLLVTHDPAEADFLGDATITLIKRTEEPL